MGCGCKSSSGVKKQVTQITKKSGNTHNVYKSVDKPVRKQIIISVQNNDTKDVNTIRITPSFLAFSSEKLPPNIAETKSKVNLEIHNNVEKNAKK